MDIYLCIWYEKIIYKLVREKLFKSIKPECMSLENNFDVCINHIYKINSKINDLNSNCITPITNRRKMIEGLNDYDSGFDRWSDDEEQ